MISKLDFEVLNGVVKYKSLALEFAHSMDCSIFEGEGFALANVFYKYIQQYKSRPTRKPLLEKNTSDDVIVKIINDFFDKADQTEYEEDLFGYDVEKLKKRYGKKRLNNIKNTLENIDDVNNTVRSIDLDIGAIKALKGEKAYKRKKIKDYIPDFRQNYIDKVYNPDLGKGLLTGYSFLDYIKNGLRPADLIIIAGETGSGKALALDTPIPTVDGWTTMGDIKVGDIVLGDDGKPCKVEKLSGVMHNRKCYEMIFSDGSKVIADAEHQWKTKTAKERVYSLRRTLKYREKRRLKRKNKGKRKIPFNGILLNPPKSQIRTTQEIKDTVTLSHRKDNRVNHSIENQKPLTLKEVELPIDPYVLGAWLGDGTSLSGSITSADSEIVERIGLHYKISKQKAKYRYGILGLQAVLRENNLIGNKHIPKQYLRASHDQRLALLQGLMDTDGFVSKDGNIEFCVISPEIRDGMMELLRTLGIVANLTTSGAYLCGRYISERYRIKFATSLSAFHLSRKVNRMKSNTRFDHRFIVSVEEVDSVPVQCIQVDNKSHMFLCGKGMIPTHNSMWMNNMAIQMWLQGNNVNMKQDEFGKGCNVTYFSLEMPYEDCFQRTMARLADVPSYGIRDAKLSKAEAKGMSKACKFTERYPYEFDIVDVPRGFSVEQLEMMFEEIKADYIPDVVFIDYMGLMEDMEARGEDWLALGKLAGKIHEFARAHAIPVVTATQLNRIDPKLRSETSKSIGLHRIGRSALIATHATMIIQIETRENEESYDDFVYHIIKNRYGESGIHASVYKNFAKCSVMDKPYDIESVGSWTPSEDISMDISKILGENDDD